MLKNRVVCLKREMDFDVRFFIGKIDEEIKR